MYGFKTRQLFYGKKTIIKKKADNFIIYSNPTTLYPDKNHIFQTLIKAFDFKDFNNLFKKYFLL